MASLTIACPTEGQTVTALDNGFVRIVLTEDSWWDMGLSAQAVMADAKGAEVWRKQAPFTKDEAIIAVIWPHQPGDYTLQAQAVGMIGRTNATVVSNFKVVAKT